MEKLISVVIATYNYGQYISHAIDSVLRQTYSNIEIIIIDDGSTDNTKDIISNYLIDKRVVYIQQKNLGQPYAKNRGVNEAKGEFIAFLDADDVWFDSKLQKQLLLFNDPLVGVVYSRHKLIDQNGGELPTFEYSLKRGWVLDDVFINNFVCFSSSIVKKNYLEQVGLFDESLPMGIDYDLWIRLSCVCKFDYVDEALVEYRSGHINLSINTYKRYEFAQKIMKKHLNNPHVRNLMSFYVPNLAWSDTLSNFGLFLAKSGRNKEGLKCMIKAIIMFPFYINAYKRIIKLFLFYFK